MWSISIPMSFVNKAIVSLNQKLTVPKIYFKVETGAMDEIKSKGFAS